MFITFCSISLYLSEFMKNPRHAPYLTKIPEAQVTNEIVFTANPSCSGYKDETSLASASLPVASLASYPSMILDDTFGFIVSQFFFS